MKRIGFLILFMAVPILTMAQASGGQVRRPIRKQQTNKPKPSQKQSIPKEKSPSEIIIQRLVNNMVFVEGGSFTMGCTPEQGNEGIFSSKPAHKVTLSSFLIGRYEVTQEEWQAVMGSNPSTYLGIKCPVQNVSWKDCQMFIRKLNEITGKQFRLPTEAEWEYAARGGNRSLGYKYSGSNYLDQVAWYIENSGKKIHDVGQKSPNELGLYDMSGNIWEWCLDWYGAYPSYSQTDPTGPSSGPKRVCRGGDMSSDDLECRVSYRFIHPQSQASLHLGLRLAM